MFLLKTVTLTLTVSFLINGAHAITNGKVVKGDKRYMVYLLRAPENNDPEKNYTAWLCGGAIVHPLYVLTSASCVYDVSLIYVVSGYRKYVNADFMLQDPCIRKKRKKVVYTSVPTGFEESYLYNYNKFWNKYDAALARVDSAFDYYDMSYYKYCSYPPAPIRVNVLNHHIRARPYRHVMALGWGTYRYGRPKGSFLDMNEKLLHYSTSRLNDVENCYNEFFYYHITGFKSHLKGHVLCAAFPSPMDENGYVPDMDYPLNKVCNKTRRQMNESEEEDCLRSSLDMLRTDDPNYLKMGGFCDNDHGGPLVTYIGGHETLIGIISVSPINADMQCRGPYLYTSMRCVGRLIHCVLYPHLRSNRRALKCVGEQSLIKEQSIKWPQHSTTEKNPTEYTKM